ncbi:MAG: hypothetical protein P1R58_09585 [bacterium]|nr:hypothetical protein [bacterium]
MLPVLFAAIMALPMYPLNPVQQDTLEVQSLHFSAGINGPNGVTSIAPDISVKYEILVAHPFVVRPSMEIQYGKVDGALFPEGNLTTITLATDLIYYRGTDHLTGYIGSGVAYSSYSFNPTDLAADSLVDNFGVTDVDVKRTVGYRITMGLRYQKAYSLEFGVTEMRPLFSYKSRFTSKQYAEYTYKSRMSNVRFTLGYLFPLRLF